LDQAEIGIYEMLGSGLREVSNPSEILISHKDEELSEQRLHPLGMRPLMLEIQALVSTAVYGNLSEAQQATMPND
jgi:DNA repair protein RadA/Sms